MIQSTEDLLEEIGVETIAAAEKVVYKGTCCGASITIDDDGVTCGSIIEEPDAEITHEKLLYPFDKKDFWADLDEIEDEVDAIIAEAEAAAEEEILAGRADASGDNLDDGWLD